MGCGGVEGRGKGGRGGGGGLSVGRGVVRAVSKFSHAEVFCHGLG